MNNKRDNLIWIDLEMTGLNPDTDRIIEIATIVTDAQLNILAEGPVLAVHQSDEVLAQMDEWNTTQHGGSGLVDRVRQSEHDERRAEAETIDFLQQWVERGMSPMCGNSICQDRRFSGAACRNWKRTFITAIWMSPPSRSWPGAGSRRCLMA